MMKVLCLKNHLTGVQRDKIGLPSGGSIEHAISSGKEYRVLGVTVRSRVAASGDGTYFCIENDWGQARFVSALLFEMSDARCSRHWRMQLRDDGTLLLWPEEFYEEFFLDDLSEGDEGACKIFAALLQRLEREDIQKTVPE